MFGFCMHAFIYLFFPFYSFSDFFALNVERSFSRMVRMHLGEKLFSHTKLGKTLSLLVPCCLSFFQLTVTLAEIKIKFVDRV